MKMPTRIETAMHLQVEAERKKRAAILESEGVKAAKINVAEGDKMQTILASEAKKQEQINRAEGEANAITLRANAQAKAIAAVASGEANAVLLKADAQARAINVVSKSLEAEHGRNAASLTIAEQYVDAFGRLAKNSNTVIVPANAGDAASMVAQALGIYSTLSSRSNPIGLPSSQQSTIQRALPSNSEQGKQKTDKIDKIASDAPPSDTGLGHSS